LSRNNQNKGTGYSGQGAGKEHETGYMRYGMKKEKKNRELGGRRGMWEVGCGIADFGFRIAE